MFINVDKLGVLQQINKGILILKNKLNNTTF